jgi:hypothetical protein
MATTNFSGPITAGNIRNTTGTTVGSNIANVGQVVMSQSVKVDIIGASHLNQVCAVIPANSQIVDVIFLATTHGTLDTEATNVGTTDIQVLADFTGASGDATTGAATVTVMYIQNNSVQDAADL